MFVDRDAHSSISNSSFSGADGSAATTPRGDGGGGAAGRPRRRRQSDLREVSNAFPHVELRPTPKSAAAAYQQTCAASAGLPPWPDPSGPSLQPMAFVTAANYGGSQATNNAGSAWNAASLGSQGITDSRGVGCVAPGQSVSSQPASRNHGKSGKSENDASKAHKGRAGGGIVSSTSSLKNFEFSPIQGQRSRGAPPLPSSSAGQPHAAMPSDQRRSIQAWVDLSSASASLPATSVLPSRASSLQATLPPPAQLQQYLDPAADGRQQQAQGDLSFLAHPIRRCAAVGRVVWDAFALPLWAVVVTLGGYVASLLRVLRCARRGKVDGKTIELSLLWGLVSLSLPVAADGTGLASWLVSEGQPIRTAAERAEGDGNVKEVGRSTKCAAGEREVVDDGSTAMLREEREELDPHSARRALRKMELRLSAVQSTLEETSASVRSLEGVVGGLHHLVMSHDAALQRD